MYLQPQSDLHGLIQLLCLIFAEQPPVFARARPAPGPSHPQQQRPTYPPYQPTPYPSNQLPPGFYQAGPAQMPMPGMPSAGGNV